MTDVWPFCFTHFPTHRTLYTMAKLSGVVDPTTKDFERSTVAYCVDAISISIGSLLGISPVTAFIESAVRSLYFS